MLAEEDREACAEALKVKAIVDAVIAQGGTDRFTRIAHGLLCIASTLVWNNPIERVALAVQMIKEAVELDADARVLTRCN